MTRAKRVAGPACRRNDTIDRDLDKAVQGAREAFAVANPRSRERAERAAAVMPGGNTRTVLWVDPFPLGLARGEACRLWDVDGTSTSTSSPSSPPDSMATPAR